MSPVLAYWSPFNYVNIVSNGACMKERQHTRVARPQSRPPPASVCSASHSVSERRLVVVSCFYTYADSQYGSHSGDELVTSGQPERCVVQ